MHKMKDQEKAAKEMLSNVIQQISPVTPTNLQKIINNFEFITFDKDAVILKDNEIPTYCYFVVKGIVRVYYNTDGRQIIDWFAEEGTFIGNLYGYITKSGFDIYESLEEVELLRAKYTDIEQLLSHTHEIECVARKLIELYYVQYVERSHQLKGLPAEEKYRLFVKNYGKFVSRIPLKYIADYLGITSETLSRIRAKELKKPKKC